MTRLPSGRWWIGFLKHLWHQILEDDVLNGAAAQAYFLLLAIFPAAIFLLTLLPYLAIPHLRQAIGDLANQVLPQQSASLFAGVVRQVAPHRSGGLLTFGVVFALWSASTGTYSIMQQLNMAYETEERRPFWKVRGTSILLTLAFILLMIVSLSLAIFGGVVQSWLASLIGWSRPLLIFFATVRWIIIGVALLLGLAVTYRFGPDVNVKFRFISPGNVAGAIFIALASIGFRIYVAHFSNYSATYGSIGAIIILMLWLYLAGIALLLGGEINAILQIDR